MIVKRGRIGHCCNIYAHLLSLKQKLSIKELVNWYDSLKQGEKEIICLRISQMPQDTFAKMKYHTEPVVLHKKMKAFVVKTFKERKPFIDQVAKYGFDKLTLATMNPDFQLYREVLSQHIKSLPSANSRIINFFGSDPAWNDYQMHFFVAAHKAALDMVSKMIEHIKRNPNSEEFISFFGNSPEAKMVVLNRLQAIQNLEQLNVYLYNGHSDSVAHSVFSGGIDGSGDLGDSLNLMGINMKASKTFFDYPAYPQKDHGKHEDSAAGFIIHELSHMFGTEDVSGGLEDENDVSNVCYGRQLCISLGSGLIKNPTDAPYNNADSYQFFANEIYLN